LISKNHKDRGRKALRRQQNKNVSLIDVAARSGVSVSTVSRVLSGTRSKEDTTKTRVQAAAKSLGYSVNFAARSLRRESTETIGLVIPHIENPFFSTLAEKLERATNKVNKELLICTSQENIDIEADRIRTLIHRQVDGIILIPCDEEKSRKAINSALSSVPLVLLDQRVNGCDCDWIGVDEPHAFKTLLTYLAGIGTRSAAFVGSTAGDSSSLARLQNFQENCRQQKIHVAPSHLLLDDYSASWGRKAVDLLLGSSDPLPDTIVCANDLIAFGVLDQLVARGIKVPQDIRVTGFDDTQYAQLCSPRLTTMSQPLENMAAEATRIICSQAESDSPEWSHLDISMKASLIVRESA
jgi:LacI family transcriptional regulator